MSYVRFETFTTHPLNRLYIEIRSSIVLTLFNETLNGNYSQLMKIEEWEILNIPTKKNKIPNPLALSIVYANLRNSIGVNHANQRNEHFSSPISFNYLFIFNLYSCINCFNNKIYVCCTIIFSQAEHLMMIDVYL